MHYDLLALTPPDRTVLEQAGATIPESWTRVTETPQLLERHVPDGTLAFIIFPADPGQPSGWSAITDMAEEARTSGRYNLIIGLCSWSISFEQDFINRHGAAFDILLGAGDGPGYIGLYEQNNALYRVRAFSKGKGIHQIDIPTLPQPGKHIWVPGQGISATYQALDAKVPDDARIKSIFGN